MMKDNFDKATEEANKRALKAEQERDAVIKERDSLAPDLPDKQLKFLHIFNNFLLIFFFIYVF